MLVNLTEIYDEFIERINDEKQTERYAENREWFHASSAGMCLRKIYFESIEQVQPVSKDVDTLRLFRLGDLVHTDIQTSLEKYSKEHSTEILIEKEIILDDLNVRGFFDVAVIEDNALYDIKTCNAWKWKLIFGRKPDPTSQENYALQLGTYGIWIERNFGQLEKLSLLYYNKNNSQVREYEFDRVIVDNAEKYWKTAKDIFENGLPPISFGTSPVQKWECNPKYCSFFEHCGGGIKPELLARS